MKNRSVISYVATFYIVAGLSFPTPAFSDILFYEDFEDALDFENDWILGMQHGSQGFTTEQARHGSRSYEFSLTRHNSGDYKQGMVATGFNNGNHHFTIGNEYWIGFSIFLPDGYYSPSDGGGILHHQYHGEPDGPPTCDPREPWRMPALVVGSTQEGEWQTFNKWDSRKCMPDPTTYEGAYWLTQDAFSTGQWYDYVVNVKWSYGLDGFLKIWRNGVSITDRTGPNCYNDNEGPYLWIGIYTFHLDQDQTITIYHDELRIGDSNSSRSEVAPVDSVPTCMSEGYQCCNADDCQSGHHAEYDGDCPGQVCCEVCGATPDTCANLGGICCNDGQICEGGSFQNSSDCGDLCCVGGTCAEQPTGYTVLMASRPPVIEGLLGEYQGVPGIEIENIDTGATGIYRLLWDDTALYIAVQVSDRDLNAEVTEHDGALYNDDSLEIMFDTLHDGGSTQDPDDYKIMVNLQNVHGDWAGWQSDWEPAYTTVVDLLGGTLNDSSDSDSGYTMEIAIPWSEWGIAPPSGGTSWGMDISLNDKVADGSYQTVWWNSTGGGMNDPDGWGTAVFSAEEQPLVCPQGYMDCNDNPADGCEVNIANDSDNCGSCGNACNDGHVCKNGSCELQCDPPLTDCSGTCVNLDSDHGNCGSCGNACDDVHVCNEGMCELECSPGLTNCGGSCVDLNNSPLHCGECFNACTSGHKCSLGKCGPDCGPGTVEMDGVCVAVEEGGGCGCQNTGLRDKRGLVLFAIIVMLLIFSRTNNGGLVKSQEGCHRSSHFDLFYRVWLEIRRSMMHVLTFYKSFNNCPINWAIIKGKGGRQ